jgi:DNA repair protein RadC
MPMLRSTADLISVVGPMLRGRSRERLVLVVCDASHRVIGCEVLSEGAVDRAIVPVREVAVAVLRRDGKVFALAHNHPAGDPTPSDADVEATFQVEAAAIALGLHFLDHIVVTDSTWRRVPMSSVMEEA